MLGVYAELDERERHARPGEGGARLHLTYEMVTYPAVNHAFFNDTGPRYNAGAATKARGQGARRFGRHLG